MKLYELDQAIKAVCPIDGINTAGVIFFKVEATPEERAAAQALMDIHLIEVDEYQAWENRS